MRVFRYRRHFRVSLASMSTRALTSDFPGSSESKELVSVGLEDSGDAPLRLTGGGMERVSTKQFLQTIVGVFTGECPDSAVGAADPVFVANLNRIWGAHEHLPQRRL